MNIQRINSAFDRVNNLLVSIAVVFLVVTVVIIITNVLSRYVLQVSLPWSAELARYSMIWSALLAAAVLANRRQHLSVDILEGYLRGGLRTAVRIITVIGSMTFFLIVLVSGWMLVMRTSGQVASSIEILPMNVVYLVIPMAALLMLLGSFVDLLRSPKDEESKN